MADLNELIPIRASSHGEFTENAGITWDLLRILMASPGWARLNDGQRHSAYMILHKLSRAVSGDPDFADHWDDIGGYAKLVSDRIAKAVERPQMGVVHALSQAWNVPMEEAYHRYLGDLGADAESLAAAGADDPIEVYKPGTPEDGGHHASQEDKT